ncbi:unnamed protein product [Cylindrotheca closterium]|uniref:Uncharacterized protein n=1 Tax=Cylindrotheca closterium TaxID=2856 RepID=A0AAD2G852_9STRA|nr:unnamed protein product [Cylindrotheca closterium]
MKNHQNGYRIHSALFLVLIFGGSGSTAGFLMTIREEPQSRRHHDRGSSSARSPIATPIILTDHIRQRSLVSLQMENPLATEAALSEQSNAMKKQQQDSPFLGVLQLILISLVSAILLISWEEVSMYHPIRKLPQQHIQQQQAVYHWGDSTVRGLAFGKAQRIRLDDDAEPQDSQYYIPSYNEIMLEHRTERIPSWNDGTMTEDKVRQSVATIQTTVEYLQDCKRLANEYDWDGLTLAIRQPILHQQLEQACNNLKHADGFLSPDARDEIGFEWASCAWRHCGALADAQEAIDELDHLIGILEPFECLFCIDIVERSLYDILAVTQKYQDPSIPVPEYQQLHRKSDVGPEGVDQFDTEYLEALQFLKKFENE